MNNVVRLNFTANLFVYVMKNNSIGRVAIESQIDPQCTYDRLEFHVEWPLWIVTSWIYMLIKLYNEFFMCIDMTDLIRVIVRNIKKNL